MHILREKRPLKPENKMKGLLLVAHGSRRKQSNEEIIKLTRQIEKIASKEFSMIDCAFLQYTGPVISEKLEHYVEKGVTDITVFPYFIAAGMHVVKDIPDMIEHFRKSNPQIRIRLTGHLGSFTEVANLIVKKVNA